MVELTFHAEPKRFSEKILIFQKGEQIGYSLRGQYVTIRGRRFPFPNVPAFRPKVRIYYASKEYASLLRFGNTRQSAAGDMLYRGKVYSINRIFGTRIPKRKGYVKLTQGEQLLGEMQADERSVFFFKTTDNGTIRLHGYSNAEEFGMFMAMLFVGKDCFVPYREEDGEGLGIEFDLDID